ncbi:MAG: hypothetical protein LBV31_03145 [Prevotellaceae bacterium]|nr:hypothetical protein [Prevotellaceae bacterium]
MDVTGATTSGSYQLTAREPGASHPILNGPFRPNNESLSGKYWGEDGGSTCHLTVIPSGATVLSYNTHNAAESTSDSYATMIVHDEKGFFWAGDGGFAAGDPTSVWTDIYPSRNNNGYPVVHTVHTPSPAYTSFVYANVIAWAIDWVNANRANW